MSTPTDQTPGWYPDPRDPGLERYWNGGAWTERTRTPAEATSRRRGWIIAGAVAVIALVGYITYAALTGGDSSKSAEAAAPTTQTLAEQRSDPDQVIAVAAKLCGDRMRLVYADPGAKFALQGWTITAQNPAGHPTPSWRVQGTTESRTSAAMPLTFYCDVEWHPDTDTYRAQLVS